MIVMTSGVSGWCVWRLIDEYGWFGCNIIRCLTEPRDQDEDENDEDDEGLGMMNMYGDENNENFENDDLDDDEDL